MRKLSFSASILLLILVALISVAPASFASSSYNNSNPITVLAKNQSTYQINLSGGYVYWNNNGTQIRRVSESGGTVQDVLNSSDILSFAVSGSFIYWSTHNFPSYLNKTDLSNDKTSVLCNSNTSEYCDLPASIQVSGNYVFFASMLITALVRIDTNGSNLIVLKPPSGLPLCVAGLTLSAGYVYWSNCGTGQAGKVSLSGKNAQYLGPNFCPNGCSGTFYLNIHSIVVANSYVYWTFDINYPNGSYFELINSISTSGGHFKTLFKGTSESGMLSSVAYFNGSVIFPYQTDSGGKIYSVPAGGGKLTVLANRAAFDSEVSGGYLYFTTVSQIDKLAL